MLCLLKFSYQLEKKDFLSFYCGNLSWVTEPFEKIIWLTPLWWHCEITAQLFPVLFNIALDTEVLKCFTSNIFVLLFVPALCNLSGHVALGTSRSCNRRREALTWEVWEKNRRYFSPFAQLSIMVVAWWSYVWRHLLQCLEWHHMYGC